MDPEGSGLWPYLPLARWQDTRDTLQLFTQIVGKVSLANAPLVNHWWNCPLRVTARGLSTSLMPHPGGQRFQIDFDFQVHRLEVVSTSGAARSFGLDSLSVADFYTTAAALSGRAGPRHGILARSGGDRRGSSLRRRPDACIVRRRAGPPFLASP